MHKRNFNKKRNKIRNEIIKEKKFKDMWRKILGIISGIISAIIFAILTVNIVPQLITQFVPPLLGGLFAGYIIRQKGWLYGMIVGTFIFIFSIIPLILMSSQIKVIPPSAPPPSNIFGGIVLGGVFSILCGAWGGCLGQLLKNLKTKKVK
jgi:hypothetical protein